MRCARFGVFGGVEITTLGVFSTMVVFGVALVLVVLGFYGFMVGVWVMFRDFL